MNDALKELFNAYKHLPIGVMFFKNRKIFFVNDHLRNVLLFQNLSADQIPAIIGEMVGLKEPTHETLYEFLTSNSSFLYHDQILQVEFHADEELDIFVIVRVSDSSVDIVDRTRNIRQMRTVSSVAVTAPDKIDQLLKSALGRWEHLYFYSIVLFRGIPVKGKCTILEAHEGGIVLHVERKQLAAVRPGVLWLIGRRRDRMISAKVERYDLERSTVWLNELNLVSSGFHMRQVIRYKADEGDAMLLNLGGKSYRIPVRDISERGVSIETDNAQLLLMLSQIPGESFRAELILSGHSMIVDAMWLYTNVLENEKRMKAAFTIAYDANVGHMLKEMLNSKQLHLIKEIHNIIDMIPSPSDKSAEDWSI